LDDEGSAFLLYEPRTQQILRGVYPERQSEILREVYPEQSEILRFAQDDRRRAQNDRRRECADLFGRSAAFGYQYGTNRRPQQRRSALLTQEPWISAGV
jgi:hypothetical protein